MKPHNTQPPQKILQFFRWFCHPELLRHIEGDLMELYHERVKEFGERKADRKFIIDVLLLFRPGIIRPTKNHYSNSNHIDMLTNYLKVGLRNILKYKVYSSINAFGLAVGMAASMLILFYITDELSYDRFLEDSEYIYRISSSGRFEGTEFREAASSPPIAEALLREVPEVEEATRFGWWRAIPMRYENKSFIEKLALVGDSNFFQFFSYPLVAGNRELMLRGTNKVVITESTARRYFGNENALGKIMLRGENRVAMEVTGIVKDPPHNSHIQFDMVFSAESWNMMQIDHWSHTFLYTYIKTKSAPEVKLKLDILAEKHLGPELETIIGLSPEQFKASGNQFGFFLIPMTDIHLESTVTGDIVPGGNIQYIYIFAAIGFFILLIACINFMNLSTARAATRAKEVGVRKSIGALRGKLIGQFLSESMIFSFIATFLALVIIGLVLNPFNALAAKNFEFNLLWQPKVLGGILAFALITGLLAGSYPAFYLTAFRPIDVLKGKLGTGIRNSRLRNSLVTFQFMISIMLIMGSIVVYRQLNYLQGINMGFDKENVIDVSNAWSLENNSQEFKNELALYPEFKSASFASALPPHVIDGNLFRKGGTEQDIVMNLITVDYDHLATMGFAMHEGRFFSPDFPSDSVAIILNETAYKQMGFKQLEGNTVINFNSETPAHFKLIGVIKDFNFENLRNSVKPMALLLNAGVNNWMVRQANNDVAIRIAGGDVPKTIAKLETIWKKYSASPFEFTFLDENIDATFRSEVRMSRVIFIFTLLTIIIACLGLFGLATYLGEQRSKEISIRKVLGASISHVIVLLLRNFVLLIAIAFLIAAPAGWYLMRSWLEGFAYRTTIEVWMIILSGVCAFVIAILTIGYQSLRVARENPVNNLKNE